MVKIIYLMRHAQAVLDSDAQSDKKRLLTQKGKQEAESTAQFITRENIIPETILVSPATRAQQTARILLNHLRKPITLLKTENLLYSGTKNDLLTLIQRLPNSLQLIFLVGHNPLLTEFSHYLSYSFSSFLETSALVGFNFPYKNWAELSAGTGRLLFFFHGYS